MSINTGLHFVYISRWKRILQILLSILAKNGFYITRWTALTFPSQGYINPMLEFSKRLEHKGLKVTLVVTNFISKTI
jgi:hypothetical protein